MHYTTAMQTRIFQLCRQEGLTLAEFAAARGVPLAVLEEMLCVIDARTSLASVEKIYASFGMTLNEFLQSPELDSIIRRMLAEKGVNTVEKQENVPRARVRLRLPSGLYKELEAAAEKKGVPVEELMVSCCQYAMNKLKTGE